MKLSSDAALVYGTYLGARIPGAILVSADNEVIIAGSGPAPGLPPPPEGSTPDFLMKLDQAASQVTSAVYIEGSQAPGLGPSALATDGDGNVIVAGRTYANFPVTPGAYASPESLSACPGFFQLGPSFFNPHHIYIVKLAASDWRPIYRSLLSTPCGFQLGAIAVDSTGVIVVALATGAGLSLRSPVLGAPSCSVTSSAVVKLSPDGSQLQYATYLDNCGVPGIALANDDSVYVGVSPRLSGNAAGVLHLSAAGSPTLSLDQVSNAFSGDAGGVTAGSLYSLAISGLQPPAIDLGMNPSQDLPAQLGPVQVTFDGIPAPILRTGPGRVIVTTPANLPTSSQAIVFTSVQVSYNGVLSNAVWMPVSSSAPGLLTGDLLDPLYRGSFADGYVQNEDGALNDADHPAAAGSTITLFATGMGATNPPIVPGSIATSLNVTPIVPVYSSWRRFSFDPPVSAETVYSMPGFVSAMFQIPIRVPTSLQGLGGVDVGNGVQRAPVGLLFSIRASGGSTLASNLIGVYLK